MFEAFIKEQCDFNKKIESHISSTSIEMSKCTIELKDLELKCKNQAKEVKLACENHKRNQRRGARATTTET